MAFDPLMLDELLLIIYVILLEITDLCESLCESLCIAMRIAIIIDVRGGNPLTNNALNLQNIWNQRLDLSEFQIITIYPNRPNDMLDKKQLSAWSLRNVLTRPSGYGLNAYDARRPATITC